MTAKILVVDDDLDLADLLCQRFKTQIQQRSIALQFAHNGIEALNIFTADPEIEIVLTDINMPQMDGLTLLSQIQQHRPATKTIIVSAYSDMANIRKAMNRGAFDFLVKPIDLQDLALTIQKTIDTIARVKAEVGQERQARLEQTALVAELRREMAERQQAEMALRRSEANNLALVKAMPDMLIWAKTDGTYLAIAGQDRFIVHDQDHFTVGTNLFDSLPPDLAQKRMQYIQQAQQTQQMQRYEQQLLIDGKTRYEEVRISVISRDEVLIVVRDITERHQAETLLLEEKRFSDTIIDSLPGVFYLYNEQAQLVRWNKLYEWVLGYSAEEIVEIRALDTIVESDRSLVARKFREALTHGAASTETQLLTRHGDTIPYYITGHRMSLGNQTYFLGIGIDITERKQAEEALRLAEAKYRGIFENALEGIFQSTVEGQYISVNPAMATIYGYPSPAAMMERVNHIGSQIYVDPTCRQILHQRLMAEGEITGFQYQAYQADNTIIWVEENTRTVKNAEGTVLYYEGIIQDITQRRQAEAERLQFTKTLAQKNEALQQARDDLAQANQTLEKRVTERTQAISDILKQLKATQAQIIAQEKLASLGALTAGIAHEIKNPLNFVNNFADLTVELSEELREELSGHQDHLDAESLGYITALLQDIKQNAEKIHKHGQRADRIVNSMLLHSRGETSVPQLTNLNGLLEEAINLAYHGMRAQNRTFNITIETDFDSSVPPLNLVVSDINRVFLNMINNACYATHQKVLNGDSSYVPVLTAKTHHQGDRVAITIRDNGLGIPAHLHHKIFEPFFTTKPTGEGTGLGLSMSYDIITQEHQGSINVASSPGEYTEFQITLPYNAFDLEAGG